MCGITGICDINRPSNVYLETLARMNSLLSHRGPDESGLYIDNQAGLGHMRLSIIDLKSGTQPIHNENETIWIVFNGEIFNYLELRKQLQSEGHRFYTSTDTEVIIHLYEDLGPQCLSRLNGQFAIAIWDSNKKELFLARDRLGICPLHYSIKNETIYFASEIKSLFTVPDISKDLDPIAIDQIFTFWTTLPQYTAFKEIKNLAPGHYLQIANGRISIRKYWDFPLYPRKEYLNLPPSEISARIKILLSDAVRIRLQADVPVASYLSGGLDSSGITSIVAKEFNQNVHTFGIRFEESDYDESIHQKNMAAFLDVPHNELFVSNDAIAENFREVTWHSEKPILRTAPVPLYLLSKRVSENGIKVILTGEGADEIFGGYNIFKEALIRKFWSRRPGSRMRMELIKQIYPQIFKNPKLENALIKFFKKGLDHADDPLFSHLIRWQNTGRIKTFFAEDFKKQIGSYDCIEEIRSSLPEKFNEYDCLSKAQYIESTIFMGEYLLSSQGDRVAMAHSVETRPPYLDHRIVEFMARVPTVWKILGLNEKYLLKKILHGILPKSILSRPKTPYRAPIQQSLAETTTSEYIHDTLSEKNIKDCGYFDAKKTKLLLNKMKSRKNISEVDNMAFAGILSTQLIDSQFIKNFPASSEFHFEPVLLIDRRTNAERCETEINAIRGFNKKIINF